MPQTRRQRQLRVKPVDTTGGNTTGNSPRIDPAVLDAVAGLLGDCEWAHDEVEVRLTLDHDLFAWTKGSVDLFSDWAREPTTHTINDAMCGDVRVRRVTGGGVDPAVETTTKRRRGCVDAALELRGRSLPLRVSRATEVPVSTDGEVVESHMFRRQVRASYYLPGYRLDFNTIRQAAAVVDLETAPSNYSVEVEVTDHRGYSARRLANSLLLKVLGFDDASHITAA